MSLRGLPDLQRPIQDKGWQICYPYEGGGNYILVPERLDVAEHHNGRPDFLLEFVRGQHPLLPPRPYGVLEFRVRPQYHMEEALTFLRGRHPEARLAPAVFSSGFLRLQPAIDGENIPEELLQPVPLAWNGLGRARFIQKLSQDTAVLLEEALRGELLALLAAAELELVGVSPRLPIHVRFNPAELLSALASLGNGNETRSIPREDVADFFKRDPKTLPLEITGEIEGPELEEFAEAMTDRVRTRFATFVPAPEVDTRSYLALVSPEEVGSGSFHWDLSEPIQVPRPYVLHLHPFEAAQQLVREHGLEAVTRKTVVPAIPTGALPVSITANLPANCLGILALGVTIYAPPRPPHRVQAVVESIELHPSENAATAFLRLSPAEKPDYTFSTFVVVRDAEGIRHLEAEPTPHSGDALDLSPHHFPVDFVPVEASQALLELAEIRGRCRWTAGEGTVEQSFELNHDQPAVALALPRGVTGAVLDIESHAREASRTLHLGPLPAEALQLDRFSFAEYGPHTIDIACVFDEHTSLFAIELLPEGRPEEPGEITVMHFTPAQPKKQWTWFAQSPFEAGYRYRTHQSFDAGGGEWSPVRSPFEPLTIHAGAEAGVEA